MTIKIRARPRRLSPTWKKLLGFRLAVSVNPRHLTDRPPRKYPRPYDSAPNLHRPITKTSTFRRVAFFEQASPFVRPGLPCRTPPRYSDVDDRAENKEDNELGKPVLHDDILRHIFTSPAALGAACGEVVIMYLVHQNLSMPSTRCPNPYNQPTYAKDQPDRRR